MEFQKIANFVNTTSGDKDLPWFLTKKWIQVYDQSGGNYIPNKEIRIKRSMLRWDLCVYSDACIVVKRDITVEGDNDANKGNKNLAFKNNVPFIIYLLSPYSEFSKYKTSITGKTPEGHDSLTNAKNVVPLKHLSNFWRSLNIPLINCEVELILTWSKNCALVDMIVRHAGNNNDPPAIVAPTGLEFKITDTKLYVQLLLYQKKMTQNF